MIPEDIESFLISWKNRTVSNKPDHLDEVPMVHRLIFKAVNRTFRDITQIDEPFGGIIFVI